MTLAEQLACVEREIKRRQRVRTFWRNGSETIIAELDQGLACMRAVAETLRGLMKGDTQ